MSKLYYIIANDAQIREKVYCEILKWSQAQQMDPLQPYSTLEEETPNFYLYNYLGQGEKENLGQLIKQYGEEVVEGIYLRTSEESETALLEQNIYQSYDPYENLAECLQEIVETVFTGYQKTAYDFAAVLQTAAIQEQTAQEAAQQAARAKEEARRINLPVQAVWQFLKKMALPVAILVAWALIVSLITVAIFNGVNNPVKEQKGNLISVTKSPRGTASGIPGGVVSASPTPTAITAPITTPSNGDNTFRFIELTTGQQETFAVPMADGYALDILGPILQNGKYGYCVSYGKNNEAYFISCTDSGTEGDYYTRNMDGTIGVVLVDNVLWYMDGTGIKNVATSVSQCALSATGEYLFFYTGVSFYCINAQQETPIRLLFAFPEEEVEEPAIADNTITPMAKESLIASPGGSYCAYINTNGDITIINTEAETATFLYDLNFQSISAVSDNGDWVYGNVLSEGVSYFSRVNVSTHEVALLTDDMHATRYLTFDGNNALYEMDDALWICDFSGQRTQLMALQGKSWELFLRPDASLYQPTDGIYMHEEENVYLNKYAQIGDVDIYQLQYNPTRAQYQILSQQDNVLWFGKHNYLYAEKGSMYCNTTVGTIFSLPVADAQLGKMNQILSADQYGGLLYLNDNYELYYYSLANQGNAEYLMDFTNVHSYLVAEDGSLYYFTKDGVLGVVQMFYESVERKSVGYYNIAVLQIFDFTAGRMAFEEQDNGVYFYYHSVTSSFSYAETYLLTRTPAKCIYLGHSNLP